MKNTRTLRVALLGCGSVGVQVARILLEQVDELESRVGARLELAGIAVRNLDSKRDVDLPAELFTTDAERLILGADIVVELIGGIEPARTLILQALEQGADVITANKALISSHISELEDAALRVGSQLYYEAAVAGAIPIIRPLHDNLAGDQINRIMGIVNGSTNYILDRMDRDSLTADEAMSIASELGYLEADPTLDVEGYDAAQKAGILARLAFHVNVPADAVYREGITGITADLIAAAKRNGQVIKLLAIAERVPTVKGETGVSVRVHPTLIPREHPLATVHGSKNAIFVNAESAGELMFYGAGAGGVETASAVLGDLVSVARRNTVGGPGISAQSYAKFDILPINEITAKYQLVMRVVDEPGVLEQLTRLFAQHKVSIARMEQAAAESNSAEVNIMIETHSAPGKDLENTVAELKDNDAVQEIISVMRVIDNV